MISRHLKNIPIHIMILRHNIRPNILYIHQAKIMKVQAPPSCTRGPTGPSFGAGVPVRPQNKVFKFQGGRTFLSQKQFFHHILNHQVLQATLLRGFVQMTVHLGKLFFSMGQNYKSCICRSRGPGKCVSTFQHPQLSRKGRQRGVTSNSTVNVHKTEVSFQSPFFVGWRCTFVA